jgi:uncharacterized protein
MSLFQIGLILAAGILAGFLNTLGGGGSLLSLPVLIFLGLPPAVANGTNRIALIVQNLVGVTNFRRKGFFYPKLSFILGVPAILGSIIGARVAVSISGEVFERILAVVMIVVLILILTRPEKKFIKEMDSENLGTFRLIVAMIAFFGVGLYGGFIQAGVGFIIIVALTLITGMSLVKVNSLKVFIILIYTISSLLVFLINGKVDFILGFTLAIGNAIGAYIGSNFAVNKGERWIRIFLIITILAMSVELSGIFELIGL